MAEKMILQLPLQPDKRAGFVAMMNQSLAQTRAYDGCISAVVWVPENSDSLVWVYEEWESRQHQRAYFKWRAETGMMEKLGPLMAGKPEIIWLQEP